MSAPVVAVTGANRGLGLALSCALAREGADVVVLCRDPDRGASARRDVAAEATGPEPALVTVRLDDLSSVRRAADELLATHDHLDALVNNASVFTRQRQVSVDGHELMLATNHLGPFLLTNLVLPLLRRAPAGRVFTVTAPSTVAIDFDDLQGQRTWKPLRAFGASKMANLLFTYELARRGEAQGIRANAIHPGLVRTDLMRDAPAPLRWATRLASKPPARAAASIVPLVLGEQHATTTSALLKGTKTVETNDFSRDPANQARLWELTEAMTGPA